jgi:hypothetical protein
MQIGDFERTIEVIPIEIPEEEPQDTPYEPEPVPVEPEPQPEEPTHV